jgi:hypothetical protein
MHDINPTGANQPHRYALMLGTVEAPLFLVYEQREKYHAMAWTCQLAGVQALLQCCSPEKRTMP